MRAHYRRLIAVTAVVLGFAFSATPPAEAGGGCHADTMSDAGTFAIDMANACFSPTVARIAVGATVTWTNRDPIDHVVTGAGSSFGDGRMLGAGAAVAVRFDGAGVFPYFCPLHPSMVGAIVVGDGRAAADGGAGPVTVAAATSTNAAGDFAATAQPRNAGAAQRALDALPWLVAGVALGAVVATGGARWRRRR